MRIALLIAITSWAIACSTEETRAPFHLMTHDAAGDAHSLENTDSAQASIPADGAVPRPKTFRAVFIADTHIIGPQYTCCSESAGADNASIVQTVERLEATRAKINGMVPRPDMVFVLGDVLHDAHHEHDFDWYLENNTAFSIAAALFEGFEMPVHFVFGNHDYEVNCNPEQTSYPHELTHRLFEHFFDASPYAAIDHKGWKFLLTNGQLGPTWSIGHEQCDTQFASYGEEQLDWIAGHLDEGAPTVVLSHYMRLVTAEDETESSPGGLFPLLDSVSNVQAVLVGHTHRWIDLTALNQGVPHHVLGATRYDEDNFWTIEFQVDGNAFQILDYDKRLNLSTCSQTWTYEGQPQPALNVDEMGDCVVGLER